MTDEAQEAQEAQSVSTTEVTQEVAPEVRLFLVMEGEMSRKDMQARPGLKKGQISITMSV